VIFLVYRLSTSPNLMYSNTTLSYALRLKIQRVELVVHSDRLLNTQALGEPSLKS